jgi:hypothetical protein
MSAYRYKPEYGMLQHVQENCICCIIRLKTSVKLLSGASGYVIGFACALMNTVMKT